MDTAGHHQWDLRVCGESQQGHQRHTESKSGITMLLVLGGWPERKSKTLIYYYYFFNLKEVNQVGNWLDEPYQVVNDLSGIFLKSDQAETGDKKGDQGLTWSQGLGLQNLFHWQGMDSASPEAMEMKRGPLHSGVTKHIPLSAAVTLTSHPDCI